MFNRVNSFLTNTPSTPNTPETKKPDEPSERNELFGIRRTIRGAFHNLASSGSGSSESPISASYQATPPSRLPPVNSDLLGMMEERERDLMRANSESVPNPIASQKRRNDGRRMAGDWGAAASELRQKIEGEESPLLSNSQERTQRTVSNVLQKNETPESSPSPVKDDFAPISDQQKKEFIAEIEKKGFTVSEEDLSDATQLTLDLYRSFLKLDENNSPELKKKENSDVTLHQLTDNEITTLPTHHIFTTLYTAIAKTLDRIPEENVIVPLEVPPTFAYTDSTSDKGGHGGSKKATIEYKGQTFHLYLKPKQEAEVRGYRLIALSDNHHLPRDQVSQFMPSNYGVVEVDGQEYFVMQDLCADNNDALLDAKLSYLIEGLGAIADREEITTSGRKKHRLDYFLMEKGAQRAPGFMVSVHSNKLLRFIHYKNSKEVLKETLSQHFTREQLIELSANLVRLAKCINLGDIAYIGTSVLFLSKNFKFIDPAHIIVNPAKQNQYPRDSKICYGTQDNFEKRKAANVNSIFAINAAIEELIEEKKDWEL